MHNLALRVPWPPSLFSGNIISQKFELAYVSEIPGVTQPDSTATSNPAPEGLVVVQTKSPPMLAAWKPARDKKKSSGSTHRHGKRPRTKSTAETPSTASVSLPLPEQGTQPSLAALPRLLRVAAVAACQQLEKGASPVCYHVQSKKLVSKVSATKPVPPKPATMPKKKAVVHATKSKSPEFLESFSSSSKSSDESDAPLAASRGSYPSSGKKAVFPKPTKARLFSGARAPQKLQFSPAPADTKSSELAASLSASISKASRGIDEAIDPSKLSPYVLVVEGKYANRALKLQYFSVKINLSNTCSPSAQFWSTAG